MTAARSPGNGVPEPSVLRGMFRVMTTIRQCDDRIRQLVMTGRIQLNHYPVRGQEAIAAGMGALLRPTDSMVTTFRGMHDEIAKGVPLRELVAELLGKATGTSKGKGGNMHIAHPASGLMATTGIVGAGAPIANGLALAAKLRGDDAVTVCCFGDGAANIGAVHEALNMAALWSLPVVFLCQNNGFGEYTPHEGATRTQRLSDRAAGYGMAGRTVDGTDPLGVLEAASEAVARARRGEGPTFLECVAPRQLGHTLADGMPYRTQDELERTRALDPVHRYRAWLVAEGQADEADIAALEADAAAAVEDAVSFALSSPDPDLSELETDVFAEAVTR